MPASAATYYLFDDHGLLWQGRGPESFEEGLRLMRAHRFGETERLHARLPRDVAGALVFAQQLDRNTPEELAEISRRLNDENR